MKFCSHCGASLTQKIPPGDNRLRYVCNDCGCIHYQNPKIVAGCIPEWEGRVLLCRRAIEPRHGYWTLPAGFMENGETALQAALRETLEEANARVSIVELYTVINLPHVNQVYMMFRSRLLDLNFSAGDESLEVELFSKQEIPWQQLAFKTIQHTLEFYFNDREAGRYRLHVGDIVKNHDQLGFVEHCVSEPS